VGSKLKYSATVKSTGRFSGFSISVVAVLLFATVLAPAARAQTTTDTATVTVTHESTSPGSMFASQFFFQDDTSVTLAPGESTSVVVPLDASSTILVRQTLNDIRTGLGTDEILLEHVSVVCTGADQVGPATFPTASIVAVELTVAPGAVVDCTFTTSPPPPATFNVTKVTNGAVEQFPFRFTGDQLTTPVEALLAPGVLAPQASTFTIDSFDPLPTGSFPDPRGISSKPPMATSSTARSKTGSGPSRSI